VPNPFEPKHEITIEIDETMITRVNDETLAFWWSLAQHNPARGFDAPEPGELAMKIGWEIIRRWLKGTSPELYHHQQSNYYWEQLRHLGKWDSNRRFVPHIVPPDTRVIREALREAADHQKIFDRRKAAEYERALEVLDSIGKPESGTPVPDAEAPGA
jgi:hypothetical protein